LTRTKFLAEWLTSQGIVLTHTTAKGATKLDKAIVDTILDGACPDDVRAVLEARRATARTTVGKLSGVLEETDADCRLRHQFQYHQAHTGRWSSRGVQLHNLPKPAEGANVEALLNAGDDVEAFCAALNDISFADALSALIRPTFTAAPGHVLVIADYAGIEARGLAWAADERWILDKYRQGEDLYCIMAGNIFGRTITKADKRERQIGKVTVLASGYGIGETGFAAYCERNKIDLEEVGLTAKEVVEAYRNSVPKIAGQLVMRGRWGGLWKDVERAAKEVIRGTATDVLVGHCRLTLKNGSLVVTLPSGRPIYYRRARIEQCQKPWGIVEQIVYDAPGREGPEPRRRTAGQGGHGFVESTYGGKMTENIVQAVCRDLLASALIQCERARLPVVIHCHDEIVAEVPADRGDDALRQLLTIMHTPPAWAEGFPIGVEGYVSTRYAKQPILVSTT
jgi:DNA polymerase